MKKIVITVLCLTMIVFGIMAIAGETTKLPGNLNGALPYVQPFTLATNQTTTGASTNTYNFGLPMEMITCQSVFTGVTPTAITVEIDGSIDGTYWSSLVTNSTVSNTNGAIFSAPTGTLVNRIRSNIVSINTSSTGASGATVSCTLRQ